MLCYSLQFPCCCCFLGISLKFLLAMPSSMTECHLYFVFNSFNEGHFDLTNTGECHQELFFFFSKTLPIMVKWWNKPRASQTTKPNAPKSLKTSDKDFIWTLLLIPLLPKENNRLQNSRRKSGREERKHEKGKEHIIFAYLHKIEWWLSYSYPY